MHYWWVNHGKKGKVEVDHGYLWSPKQSRSGARIQYYENMRRAEPGDAVLSCFDGQIAHVGRVRAHARTAAKPASYGAEVWNHEGWRLPVNWERLPQPVEPQEIVAEVRSWLPEIHSPMRADGELNQVYLTAIPRPIFDVVMRHAGARGAEAWIDEGRRRGRGRVSGPSETEREQTTKVRIGQGLFRTRILDFERKCRLTGIENPRLLVASHIKPWRDCTSEERLDGANGLLLTPHVDRLFDRGLISFEDTGEVKVAPRLTDDDLQRLGLGDLQGRNVGAFDRRQQVYLDHHRRAIFATK